MPNYEFTCRNCGIVLNQVQAIKLAVTVPSCSKCAELMTRSYNFGAVTFNGPGFYSTDKFYGDR
jgi:putative FmdB family regulatory protein